MSTIELLNTNARDGIRFPYPADDQSLKELKGKTQISIRGNTVVFDGCVMWERGERLLLTARRICGRVWIQLQTLKELA